MRKNFNIRVYVCIVYLQHFKEELLKLDFENIVKYIQVTLPKKCRSHKVAREIVNAACKCKIKQKKLTKYESEFAAMNGSYTNAFVIQSFSMNIVLKFEIRLQCEKNKCRTPWQSWKKRSN